jgi:hypothetical protein
MQTRHRAYGIYYRPVRGVRERVDCRRAAVSRTMLTEVNIMWAVPSQDTDRTRAAGAVMFGFLLQRHLPDNTLSQYRARLLDQQSSDLLEAHLMLCPTCQLQLEGLLPTTTARSLGSD